MTAYLTDKSRLVQRAGTKPAWLLTGILTCIVCGNSVVATPDSKVLKDGTRNRYYRCKTKAQDRYKSIPGNHPSINVKVADEVVLRALSSAIRFTPNDSSPQAQTHEGDLDMLDAQLSEIVTKQGQFALAMAEGVPWAVLAPQNAELTKQADELQRRKAEFLKTTVGAFSDIRRTIFARNSDGQIIMDLDSPDPIRATIDALPLDEKRELVKQHLEVTTAFGKGAEKLCVRYKLATVLNPDE